jgi:hypothetical protein
MFYKTDASWCNPPFFFLEQPVIFFRQPVIPSEDATVCLRQPCRHILRTAEDQASGFSGPFLSNGLPLSSIFEKFYDIGYEQNQCQLCSLLRRSH